MWRKLRKQIGVQQEMLRKLTEDFEPLLRKCRTETPNRIELSALAMMLASFYGGVENVFKRVVVELEDELPSGEGWHRALLTGMVGPSPARPALITVALATTLERYMKFRHLFRNVYPFQLNWEDMKEVVQLFEETRQRVDRELDEFLRNTADRE